MRKVLFKTWIPRQTEIINNQPFQTTVKGTGCWSSEYTESGIFHQWAASYEEFETGAGNFTVAIVEMSDGTIKEVLPSNVKFII